MPPNLIVVRIDGRNFCSKFSEVHEFEKPNDEKALNLMNQCAMAVLEEYPDIVFSYGYSDEYSFVLKKTSKFYQRRSRMLENKTEMNFSINSLVLTTMIVLHCFVKELVFSRLRLRIFWEKILECTCLSCKRAGIDGCHFHRFSDVHEFNKPNDKQALDLMNLCGLAVLEEFQDIVFSYGVSDEYSFVLKKDSQLYQRQASKIVSAIVSFFSSVYVMKWKEIFQNKDLKYPPSFDGRAVCYPSTDILLDYLAWRQVDCHINNQYNTCFWSLVKSGKSKNEAQNHLKGTQAREKNELLLKEFGIDYNTLPLMFRQGSSIFRVKIENTSMLENDASSIVKTETKIIMEYCNIIELSFWEAYPSILD
ncbi:hypothetical protein V6N12_024246 [Hibiscus sabdariffa]|uniref:tRNA(His) guanylyltransferase n=1 Tax=Hibiscus sabdariffa TaxID=183260 RepID=A0ABR2G010_9ROSI